MEEGIRVLEATTPDFVAQLDELIHGTTLVMNSIIKHQRFKTGLITTKGFRDILEIGREMRYAPYDLFAEFPRPLIPQTISPRGGRKDPKRRERPPGPRPPEEARAALPVPPSPGC